MGIFSACCFDRCEVAATPQKPIRIGSVPFSSPRTLYDFLQAHQNSSTVLCLQRPPRSATTRRQCVPRFSMQPTSHKPSANVNFMRKCRFETRCPASRSPEADFVAEAGEARSCAVDQLAHQHKSNADRPPWQLKFWSQS